MGETLVLLLTQQLEQARMAAAKDLPAVQVLDTAVPAKRAFKPKLRVNLMVSAVLALFVGVLVSLAFEYVSRWKPRSGISA